MIATITVSRCVFPPAYYDDPVVADRKYHNLQPSVVKLFRWVNYPFLPSKGLNIE